MQTEAAAMREGRRLYTLNREQFAVPLADQPLTCRELLIMARLDPDQQIGHTGGGSAGEMVWRDPDDMALWGVELVTRTPEEIAQMRERAEAETAGTTKWTR